MFTVGEYSYYITDEAKHEVVICDGPYLGIVPAQVEFENNVYTVVGSNMRRKWDDFFLDDTINHLGHSALFNHYYRSFTIPRDLQFYGYIPFPTADFFQSNSERFAVENGLVIDKKFKRVVQCIDRYAQSIVVPDGIKEIHAGAFCTCKLTSVHLPTGLKRIGMDAFYACRNLKSITIPASVEVLEAYAFYECIELTDIFVRGSKLKMEEYCAKGLSDECNLHLGPENLHLWESLSQYDKRRFKLAFHPM